MHEDDSNNSPPIFLREPGKHPLDDPEKAELFRANLTRLLRAVHEGGRPAVDREMQRIGEELDSKRQRS